MNLLPIPDKPGKPGTPSYSHVTNSSVQLTWKPPAVDGGSPITNYVVEYKPEDGFKWVRANLETVTEPNYNVTGLDKDREYVFRVSAENRAGQGPYAVSEQAICIKEPLGEY